VEAETNNRLWVGEDISVYLGLEGDDGLVVIGPDRVTVEAIVSEISIP